MSERYPGRAVNNDDGINNYKMDRRARRVIEEVEGEETVGAGMMNTVGYESCFMMKVGRKEEEQGIKKEMTLKTRKNQDIRGQVWGESSRGSGKSCQSGMGAGSERQNERGGREKGKGEREGKGKGVPRMRKDKGNISNKKRKKNKHGPSSLTQSEHFIGEAIQLCRHSVSSVVSFASSSLFCSTTNSFYFVTFCLFLSLGRDCPRMDQLLSMGEGGNDSRWFGRVGHSRKGGKSETMERKRKGNRQASVTNWSFFILFFYLPHLLTIELEGERSVNTSSFVPSLPVSSRSLSRSLTTQKQVQTQTDSRKPSSPIHGKQVLLPTPLFLLSSVCEGTQTCTYTYTNKQ